MLTHEDIRIDYAKVFSILPKIMSMPMEFIGNKWYAARKIDGSFSSRRDKLVCRMVEDGVQVLEQGGEAMTLFNWMLEYGGARDKMEAKLTLLNLSAAVLDAKNYIEKEIDQRFVPIDYAQRSYERRIQKQDNFTRFLWQTFGHIKSEDVLKKYRVGCSWHKVHETGKYNDMTQFWYINRNQEVCHDKILLYKEDGHRDHSFGGGRGFTKAKGYSARCFFGEHLLPNRRENERVFVCESEKAAIIADLYFGKGIWLATGGKCNFRKAGVGADWTFIADCDAWEYWKGLCFNNPCPKWWESYKGYEPGEHDDIADLILNHLIKK